MWKTTALPDNPETTIWRMRIICWVPKATNTHSQYVIITAVPPQQSLQESASMLRYTCIACLFGKLYIYIYIFLFFWRNSPLLGLGLLLIHKDFCGF